MLKSTKEKLLKEVDDLITKPFKEYGFETSICGLSIWNSYIKKHYAHDELERKYNLLLKHLGSEYFKKEIKETNGHEKSYVKEGFRKIKK